MKILEFVDQYCQDLVNNHKDNSKLIDWTQFPYDDVIEDGEGKKIPVVYVDSQPIPSSDFVEMDKDEFLSYYKMPSASEAYDNYVDGLIIIEGEDVISRLRNRMKAEADRIKDNEALYNMIC